MQVYLVVVSMVCHCFGQGTSSLVCGNYSVEQGNEGESYNKSLKQFEKIAAELSKDAKGIIRKLKKGKQSRFSLSFSS